MKIQVREVVGESMYILNKFDRFLYQYKAPLFVNNIRYILNSSCPVSIYTSTKWVTLRGANVIIRSEGRTAC